MFTDSLAHPTLRWPWGPSAVPRKAREWDRPYPLELFEHIMFISLKKWEYSPNLTSEEYRVEGDLGVDQQFHRF